MRCLNCHYSLKGLSGSPHRCPECGREFDPDDWDTFDSDADPSIRLGVLGWLLLLFTTWLTFGLFNVLAGNWIGEGYIRGGLWIVTSTWALYLNLIAFWLVKRLLARRHREGS